MLEREEDERTVSSISEIVESSSKAFSARCDVMSRRICVSDSRCPFLSAAKELFFVNFIRDVFCVCVGEDEKCVRSALLVFCV